MQERLQKILAQWGIASRRSAEKLIEAGRVTVNGAIAEIGQTANASEDRIALDGKLLSSANRPDHHYFLLNKPRRVVSSCHDPQGRQTVISFLPQDLQQGAGIHPVGRLDYSSTGALLLTNDGELTYQLTHPRHHIAKTYRVTVSGNPSDSIIRQWQQGVTLSGRQTLPAKVKVVSTTHSQNTELEIVLWEGRNRQIRRVAEQLGHPVKQLHRIEIGPLRLGNLKPAQIRRLTPQEIEALRHAFGRSSGI